MEKLPKTGIESKANVISNAKRTHGYKDKELCFTFMTFFAQGIVNNYYPFLYSSGRVKHSAIFCSVTIQMDALQQYFSHVLFALQYFTQ